MTTSPGFRVRHEELIDIGAETLAVDRSVKQAGRVDAVALRKAGEERLRSSTCPAEPCRRGALPSAQPSREALSCWSSSRSLIDEDQTLRGSTCPW